MDRRKFLGVGLAAFAAMVVPGTDLKAMDFRATSLKLGKLRRQLMVLKHYTVMVH